MKYKLSKIDLLEEASGWQAMLGNFVHDVLEELHKLPCDERTQFNAKLLLADQWSKSWGTTLAEVLPDEAELKKIRWSAWWAVENYFAIEDPTQITVGEVETGTNMTKVAGVPIKGFVDRWDPVGDNKFNIIDYKTGKTPRPMYREKKYQQLLIYADAMTEILQKEPNKVTLLYLQDGTRLEKNVTESDLDKMRKTVADTYAEILRRCETGDFPPVRNGLCKDYCSYKNICPLWN